MAMSFYAAASGLCCSVCLRIAAMRWRSAALRRGRPWQAFASLAGLEIDDPRLRARFAGMSRSPVGLAAGFDKNCDCLDALSWLGFGFITVGSIMPEPRLRQPVPAAGALSGYEVAADSMGVPSKGLDYATARLAECRHHRVPIYRQYRRIDRRRHRAQLPFSRPLRGGRRDQSDVPEHDETGG